MFTPIDLPDQPPSPGKVNEKAHLDFKADPTDDRFEIAKDVAALANAQGGTILIGAAGKGEYLQCHKPLSTDEASRSQRAYEEAVRDRCSPLPLFSVAGVPLDGGFVVAVNVWPFPGQLVGVEIKKGEAKCGKGGTQPEGLYYFPVRVGAHTVGLTPEQLAMFMDPKARRIALCLEQALGQTVTIHSSKNNPREHWQEEGRLDGVDFLGSAVTVSVRHRDEFVPVALPLDLIDAAWRSADRWNLLIAGRIEEWEEGPDGFPSETGRVRFFFTTSM
jgi:hypothetical protein